MKINHPSFRKPAEAKATDDFCPNSPDGEHPWQDVVKIEGPPLKQPPKRICVMCGRSQ